MEIVEKCLKPLIRLLLRLWKTCGRNEESSTCLWAKYHSIIYSLYCRWIPAIRRCISCIFFAENDNILGA